jgi:hypothetical protein
MSSENLRSSGHSNWPNKLRSVSLRIGAVVAECNQATSRMMELRYAPDRFLPDSGQAPDDYTEFLFRTSGPLRHEPSARQRAAGRSLR